MYAVLQTERKFRRSCCGIDGQSGTSEINEFFFRLTLEWVSWFGDGRIRPPRNGIASTATFDRRSHISVSIYYMIPSFYESSENLDSLVVDT